MLESPAWRVLSLSARRIVDRVEIELAHHGGTDNGKLPVTYQDFIRYGIDGHAVAAGIREAEALGFLAVVHDRAGNAEFRTPNRYRLTYRNTDHDNPTHNWRRIILVEEAMAETKAKLPCLETTLNEPRTKSTDFPRIVASVSRCVTPAPERIH